jgi:hypothetical protein
MLCDTLGSAVMPCGVMPSVITMNVVAPYLMEIILFKNCIGPYLGCKNGTAFFFQFFFEYRVQHLKGDTIYNATDISLQQNIFAFMNKNVLLNNANHKQPLKLEHF